MFGIRLAWIAAMGVGVAAAGHLSAATLSGAYLAARQAGYHADFKAAAKYYERALIHDQDNPALIEAAAASRLSLGELDRAHDHALRLQNMGQRSQLAQIALIAGHAKAGRYGDIVAMIEADKGIVPLADALLEAWARLGEGDMSAAMVRFDELATQQGLSGFANYHKALALASLGEFEGAADLMEFRGRSGAMSSRRGMIARAQVLSQLGRNDEAIDLMAKNFAGQLDPELDALRGTLERGEKVPFSLVSGPLEGMAEVFYTIAGALEGETGDDYTILYSRTAEYLRPGYIDAILLSAQLLEDLEQHDLAVDAYGQVPQDDSAYHAAVLGQADALRTQGKVDEAIAALEALAGTHGHLPIVHVSLGDLYRGKTEYAAAVAAYDRAVALYDEPGPAQWFVFFARGISNERQAEWSRAESDFRTALKLSPDQPQVLNYLGYSLVEKQQKLDEALEMIERAVTARPDAGHIVDSLGWVLYRLGRYREAVEHMERAAELMPVDPVVNDHLGDVYWAVGRLLEARFQWHRALSFVDPDDPHNEADPKRIRRKLEVGLDAVLVEEGAPPLKVVENGAD